MTLSPVKSSVLAAVGYDPDTQALEVELKSGGIYRYLDVPEEVAREFAEAPSAGAFWTARVKTVFECEVLRAPEPKKPKGSSRAERCR